MTQTTPTTVRAPFVAQHGEVDGVRAVWSDLAVDPTLTLVFGVGYEDATPATAGITHLVEHLVMRRVGHVAIPNNAESSLRSTSFYAVGPADQRVDFVARVCEAVTWLRGIDDADLDLERRTILSELGPSGVYAARDAISTRYGVRGPGLTAVVHARLLDWTAAEVREVAVRWFHRGNAHLVSTTPLPDGVRVPLPDGPAVTRAAAPVPVVQGRTCSDADGTDLVLSGTCSTAAHETARALAASVLRDVLHETLRTTLGHVYSVSPLTLAVDPATDLWLLSMDPGPESVDDVLVAALDVVERLAAEGPAQAELDRTRTMVLHELDLSGVRAGWLDAYASCTLRGLPLVTPDETRAVADGVTPADVRAVIHQFAAALLITLPAGHAPQDAVEHRLEAFGAAPLDLYPDPEGRTGWAFARAILLGGERGPVLSALRGGNRVHKGKLASAARGLKVVVLPDRLVLELPGAFWTIPFADLVLVGSEANGDLELVTSRGGVLTLSPRDFRGLTRPLTRALDRLPPGVRYRKDRTSTEGTAARTTA